MVVFSFIFCRYAIGSSRPFESSVTVCHENNLNYVKMLAHLLVGYSEEYSGDVLSLRGCVSGIWVVRGVLERGDRASMQCSE